VSTDFVSELRAYNELDCNNNADSLDPIELWLLYDHWLGRKESDMMIGVDCHPTSQQIAFLMEETAEYSERELNHSAGEAQLCHRHLHQRGIRTRLRRPVDSTCAKMTLAQWQPSKCASSFWTASTTSRGLG
jgi:hypothetical protein